MRVEAPYRVIRSFEYEFLHKPTSVMFVKPFKRISLQWRLHDIHVMLEYPESHTVYIQSSSSDTKSDIALAKSNDHGDLVVRSDDEWRVRLLTTSITTSQKLLVYVDYSM